MKMGGGNMMNLIKQAQKMQEDIKKARKEIDEKIFKASVANGLVEMEINGKKEIQSINIKKEAVDPDDVEMLEDLMVAVFNEAIDKVNEEEKEKLGNTGMPEGMQGLM